jgi:hypothetical protein
MYVVLVYAALTMQSRELSEVGRRLESVSVCVCIYIYIRIVIYTDIYIYIYILGYTYVYRRILGADLCGHAHVYILQAVRKKGKKVGERKSQSIARLCVCVCVCAHGSVRELCIYIFIGASLVRFALGPARVSVYEYVWIHACTREVFICA